MPPTPSSGPGETGKAGRRPFHRPGSTGAGGTSSALAAPRKSEHRPAKAGPKQAFHVVRFRSNSSGDLIRKVCPAQKSKRAPVPMFRWPAEPGRGIHLVQYADGSIGPMKNLLDSDSQAGS